MGIFGRRVKKTNQHDGTSIRYLWQANRLLAEVNDEGFFDPDDAQINQNYTTYLHEPGTHIPSVMFKGKGSEAEPYFYINDHLGTPQELVDFDGNIVWAALYEAYGMVNAVLIPKITQNIRFQGQYFDAESGLHYNRHRYYDPTTGRYITQDPIGLAGGLNSTQYVKNPTGWIDPLGLTCIPGNCPKGLGINSDGVYDPHLARQQLQETYGASNVTSTSVPPPNISNVKLAGKIHSDTGVPFDQRGFPIFDLHSKADLKLPDAQFKAGSYTKQMKMASQQLSTGIKNGTIDGSKFSSEQLKAIHAGNSKIPGLTWHHHQQQGRMQLVFEEIHSQTGHIGGNAMSRGQ